MSHYYAKILKSGRKTTPTARGHKTTGIVTQAACADGAIEVRLYHEDGKDYFEVKRTPWFYEGQRRGRTEVLAKGELNDDIDKQHQAFDEIISIPGSKRMQTRNRNTK